MAYRCRDEPLATRCGGVLFGGHLLTVTDLTDRRGELRQVMEAVTEAGPGTPAVRAPATRHAATNVAVPNERRRRPEELMRPRDDAGALTQEGVAL